MSLLGFGLVPLAVAAQPVPLGSEFQVNTYTRLGQYAPAVAADSDGDFVVVWHSNYQEGSYGGIFGQRYSSNGTAQGTEFQVNTYTRLGQYTPAVAADSDGDFVVVWNSNYQDGSYGGIFGQRYSSNGTAQGTEFQVNTCTTNDQYASAVAADSDGDFVVVWRSSFQDGSGLGVFGQRYSSNGTALGTEFQVNTHTTNDQYASAVAADSDGDFVVVWNSDYQDGAGEGVFGQRYSSNGTAQGTEFQVNTYTMNVQIFPAVAADSDGDFVVVWRSNSQDGDSSGIFGQRYSSNGTVQGTEFQVNTYTTDRQYNPAVAADSDGDFVVVWNSYSQDGSRFGTFGQRYRSNGTAQGTEFQVNTYTTNDQYLPAVAAGSDGDFAVVWSSSQDDGYRSGIFGQRYVAEPTATGTPTDTPTATPTASPTATPSAADTPTVTPTGTATASPTATPTPAPVPPAFTSGTEPGSEQVCGTATPDLGPGCIFICSVGNDDQPNTGDDDCSLGSAGGTDSSGNFCAALMRPLVSGDRIFIRDECSGLSSSVANVLNLAPAPLLSPAATALALALLSLVALIAFRRAEGRV